MSMCCALHVWMGCVCASACARACVSSGNQKAQSCRPDTADVPWGWVGPAVGAVTGVTVCPQSPGEPLCVHAHACVSLLQVTPEALRDV